MYQNGNSQIDERIASLEKRVRQLEVELKEQYGLIPESGVFSKNFLRRAFAIFGHNFIAVLFISIPLFIILPILMSLFFGDSFGDPNFYGY